MRIKGSGLRSCLTVVLSLVSAGWIGLAAGADPVPEIRSMTDAEQQSAGCLLSATAAMGAAHVVGLSEVIMLVVGGLIVPSSSSMLYLTLMGTMASLSCSAGATVTPLVTRVWRELQVDTPPPSKPVDTDKLADDARVSEEEGPSDALKQGIGCLATGAGSTTYAAILGSNEALMVAAGGLLVPSTSGTLWLGLMSTLAAGTCSLGAAATPAVLWAYEQKDNIGANLADLLTDDDQPVTESH